MADEIGLRVIDTPIGRLLLEATSEVLSAIWFENDKLNPCYSYWMRTGETPNSSDIADLAATQLLEYFAGTRKSFDIPLDYSANGFYATARYALETIKFGQTVSYAKLASMAGNPNAIRAAGTACSRNPIPIVVPCHRVLRSDGSLGGYRGGLAAKRWLLKHEGVGIAS